MKILHILFLIGALNSITFSQSAINKISLKKQCNYDNIRRTSFVVSEYKNNPSNFKYIYDFNSEIDDKNVNLYIDSHVCSFMTYNYKKIAFKDKDNDYYKIKNIIVNDKTYTSQLDNCIELNDSILLKENSCVIHKNTSTAATTTSHTPTTTTTTTTTSTTSNTHTTTTTTTSHTHTTTTTTTSHTPTTTSHTHITTNTNTSNTTMTNNETPATTQNSSIEIKNNAQTQESKINENEGENYGVLIGSIVGGCCFIAMIALLVKTRNKNTNTENENIFFNSEYDTNAQYKKDFNTDYEEPASVIKEPIYYSQEQPQEQMYEQADNVGYMEVENNTNEEQNETKHESESEHESQHESESEHEYDNPKYMNNKVRKNTNLHDHINDFATKNNINVENQ